MSSSMTLSQVFTARACRSESKKGPNGKWVKSPSKMKSKWILILHHSIQQRHFIGQTTHSWSRQLKWEWQNVVGFPFWIIDMISTSDCYCVQLFQSRFSLRTQIIITELSIEIFNHQNNKSIKFSIKCWLLLNESESKVYWIMHHRLTVNSLAFPSRLIEYFEGFTMIFFNQAFPHEPIWWPASNAISYNRIADEQCN